MHEKSETQTNFSWLKKIKPALIDLNVFPLLGHQPSIDWEAICTSLMQKFQIQDVDLSFRETAWKTFEDIGRDFGPQSNLLPLHITPLNGIVFWVMSNRDIQKISSWALTQEKPSSALQTMHLQEGFYRYIALEALDAIFSIPPLENLTPQMTPFASCQEEMLCFDVEIHHGQESCLGRLAMSTSLQKSWRHHFFSEDQSFFSEKIAKSLELPLSLVIGEVILDYTTLQSIQPGDFVTLDQASYDPRSHQGTVALKLGQEHLFQVLLKHNKIKLLDIDIHHEEQTAMDQLPPEEELPSSDESTAPPGATQEAQKEKGISLKELPLTITVEVARFSMPLHKLMKLEPGNFLELPVHPDQGVNLHINGKKVGRAELVHLGEALGIRILELGK